ncbi:MAG: di-heme oxidoredictase family protein [bacterium]
MPGTLAGDRPPPNLRRLQRGHFGGPDAASCADCHWKGGLAGAGDRADNSLLYGDGETLSTHEPRNPPALWGAGWTERIAAEMTAELAAQVAAARAEATATRAPVRVALSAKGTGYGLATAHPDGRLDTSAVRGIDPDLIVKPFGWKGIFPNLRAFVAHSLHIHFNLQAEELVAAPGELDLGGDGDDPDRDGVTREITEGQLTALVIFLATQDAPRLEVPVEGGFADPFAPELPAIVDAPEFTDRWLRGAEVFATLGCGGCHTPFMEVGDPVYRTRPALTGGETQVDLARDGARPTPARDPDDAVWRVPVFSDFRRHDMGPLLTGRHPERGVPESHWMTRRLWGLAQTGPYLHDGSAVTVEEAITRHGGEAAFAADGYRALPDPDRASLTVFLMSLRRAPAIRVR